MTVFFSFLVLLGIILIVFLCTIALIAYVEHASKKADQSVDIDLDPEDLSIILKTKDDCIETGIQKTVLPEIPAGKQTFLPKLDYDEEERINNSPYCDRSYRGQAFLIAYTDMRGNLSKRRITVDYIKENFGEPKIFAWCHERQAMRTFFVRKISECVDLSTGEVIDDTFNYFCKKLYEKIAAVQRRKELPPPDTWLEEFEKLNDEIVILLIVARGDGRMIAKERDLLIEYCLKKSPNLNTDLTRLVNKLKGCFPLPVLLEESLGRAKNLDAPARRILVEFLHKIVNADQKLKGEEEKIIKSVESVLA